MVLDVVIDVVGKEQPAEPLALIVAQLAAKAARRVDRGDPGEGGELASPTREGRVGDDLDGMCVRRTGREQLGQAAIESDEE